VNDHVLLFVDSSVTEALEWEWHSIWGLRLWSFLRALKWGLWSVISFSCFFHFTLHFFFVKDRLHNVSFSSLTIKKVKRVFDKKTVGGNNMLLYEKLSNRLVPALYRVHKGLGPGLLESCYCQAMIVELSI
jgi:hypothetical protein